MKNLLRKWTLQMRRNRLKKTFRTKGQRRAIEESARAAGHTCSNCGAALTGPFCHICGQKDSDLRRPVWTFLREALDNLFSTDSRLAKTVAMLLLIPGGLSRSHLDGRRASYVPPARLYISVSLLFFIVVAVNNILILDINVQPKAQVTEPVIPPEISNEPDAVTDKPAEPLSGIRLDKKDLLAGLEKARPDLSEEDAARMDALIEEVVTPAMKAGENAKPALSFSDDGFPYDIDISMFVPKPTEERPGLKQEDIDGILQSDKTPPLFKEAVRGFARGLKEPEAFNNLLNKWLPRALFGLMPIFALILRVFHWGGRRYYLHQLVFSLHYHSFLFLLVIALMLLMPIYGGEFGIMAFWIVSSLYLIVALKIGEDQGWIRAFIKAGFIWTLYFYVMIMGIGAAVFWGLREL